MSSLLHQGDNILVFGEILEKNLCLNFQLYINGKLKIWKINIELDDAGDPREYYSWNTLASLFFSLGYNFGGDHSEIYDLGILRQWIAKLS